MKKAIVLAILATVGLCAQPARRAVGGITRVDRAANTAAAESQVVSLTPSGDTVIRPGVQNQEGSVEIAKSVRPADGDATLPNFTKCALDLKDAGVKEKDAIEACTKVAKIMADVTKRVANEAADATKSSRTTVILRPRYGGGYY